MITMESIIIIIIMMSISSSVVTISNHTLNNNRDMMHVNTNPGAADKDTYYSRYPSV